MSNHLIAYVPPPFYLSRHSCMVSCIRRPDDGLRPLVEYFVWRQHFPRSCSIWVYGMFMSLHAQYLQWKKYFSLYSFRNKTNWTYRDSYASFAQIFLICFLSVYFSKNQVYFYSFMLNLSSSTSQAQYLFPMIIFLFPKNCGYIFK